MADDDEAITLNEAMVALGICFSVSDLPEPFGEPLTIPKLVGMAVYTVLGWADRGAALAMAMDAANGVRPEGNRSILLSCDWTAPAMKWCDQRPDPFRDADMPVLFLPADRMARNIAGRLAEYRAAVQRPN